MLKNYYWIVFTVWLLFMIITTFFVGRKVLKEGTASGIPHLQAIIISIISLNLAFAIVGPIIIESPGALCFAGVLFLLSLHAVYPIIFRRATETQDLGSAGFMKRRVSMSKTRGDEAVDIGIKRVLRCIIIGQAFNIIMLITFH